MISKKYFQKFIIISGFGMNLFPARLILIFFIQPLIRLHSKNKQLFWYTFCLSVIFKVKMKFLIRFHHYHDHIGEKICHVIRLISLGVSMADGCLWLYNQIHVMHLLKSHLFYFSEFFHFDWYVGREKYIYNSYSHQRTFALFVIISTANMATYTA